MYWYYSLNKEYNTANFTNIHIYLFDQGHFLWNSNYKIPYIHIVFLIRSKSNQRISVTKNSTTFPKIFDN